jgi:hypothetical protein
MAAADPRRLARAIAASAATGAAIYTLVVRVALPTLEARLTRENVDWLRQAFDRHPATVLGVIVVIAAVLALPVLGVFRWIYGPLRVSSRDCA